MRIGILTLPFNNNYGGYLQAYALMTILKEMGHEVILINRRNNKAHLSFQLKFTCKQIIRSMLTLKTYPLFYDYECIYDYKGSNMLSFVNKHIVPQTKPIFSSKELKEKCINLFDVCIVGSDQVWRPIYVPEIEDFFLRFIKDPNVKKIAYAASFGTCNPEYTREEALKCGECVKCFDAISVREQSGVDVMRRFNWECSKVEVVLDPTMLLTKEHYFNLINKCKNLENKKRIMFCYVLDKNMENQKIINEVGKIHKLIPYNIIDPLKYMKHDYVMPSIEDWLIGIRDSELIITDSFHGTVFSILFNKPFIVLVNKKRGSDRFISLLNILGLEDRIVCKIEDIKRLFANEIDWKAVNTKIEKKRIKSFNFIKNSLL